MASPAARSAAGAGLRGTGDRWEAVLREARRRGAYGLREPLSGGVRRAPARDGAARSAPRGAWWAPAAERTSARGEETFEAALEQAKGDGVSFPIAATGRTFDPADVEQRRAIVRAALSIDSDSKAALGVLARAARRFPRGVVEPEPGAPPALTVRRMSRRMERLVEGERVPALSKRRGELFTFAMQAAVEDGRLPSPVSGRKELYTPPRDYTGLPRGIRASRRITPEESAGTVADRERRETALDGIDDVAHADIWKDADPGLVRYFNAHSERVSAFARQNRKAMARQLWRGITAADRIKPTGEGVTAIEAHELYDAGAEDRFEGLSVKLSEYDESDPKLGRVIKAHRRERIVAATKATATAAAGEGASADAETPNAAGGAGEDALQDEVAVPDGPELDALLPQRRGRRSRRGGRPLARAAWHRIGTADENFERMLYKLQDYAGERRMRQDERAADEARQREAASEQHAAAAVEDAEGAEGADTERVERRRRIAEVQRRAMEGRGGTPIAGDTAAARLAELSRQAAEKRRQAAEKGANGTGGDGSQRR